MVINIFIIVALIAVLIGSYTDIKTLEVPDWLNYSLIAIGLGGNLIFTIANLDTSYIIKSLSGLGISIVIGLIMFYTGQWGGGDSKMIFGLGAMFGFDYKSLLNFQFDFFTMFFINMLVAGAAYGLIWVFIMALKNRKKLFRKTKIAFRNKKLKQIRILSGFAAIIGLLVIYFLPDYIDGQIKILFSLSILILYFMNYLFIIIKVVEEVSMVRLINPEKLTEGDWIVNDIIVKGKRITGPKDLGISKKNIEKLIRLKQQGEIGKIKVKYGIPFVPSFLIALVYTIIFNNIILLQVVL